MGERVHITIDDEAVSVPEGAMLASVLMQRPDRRCRTSVTGEPRGAVCGMGVCYECRVTVDGRAHVRSCQERVREGLRVSTRGPCYENPTGGPERRNLGRLTTDVVVIGAGPAGLAAADAACASGAGVIVVDDNPRVGGQIWRSDVARGDHDHAASYRRRIADAGARLLHATVIDGTPDAFTFVTPNGDLGEIDAKSTVVATGARELIRPFPGWTLPGVTGAGGMQALVKGGLDVSGLRVLVAGSGPLLLAVAALLRQRGADVVAVCERASKRSVRRLGAKLLMYPKKLRQGASLLRTLKGIPVHHETVVSRAEGADTVHRAHLEGRHAGTIDIDLLAIGDGLVPQLEIPRMLGCTSRDGGIVGAWQDSSVPGIFIAGETTGVGGVDLALAEGRVAGHAAAGDLAAAGRWTRARDREARFADALRTAYESAPASEAFSLPAPTIVCRCEDVTCGDLLSARKIGENDLAGAREIKLRTRCGMGPCQGRTCGASRDAMLLPHGATLDRARPPLSPTPVETLILRGTSETKT